MPPTVRERLRAHPPHLLDALATRPAPEGFAAADHEFAHALACPGCGGEGFRVLGVPVAMEGIRAGYVLRSVLRIWRELRSATESADGVFGRLGPPVALDCTRCGRRTPLVARSEDAGEAPPLEALRCRPCRRSTFAVAVTCAHHDADLEAEASGGEEERYDAWRLDVRCRACGTRAEPFARVLRGEQQRTLDRLYGRGGGDDATGRAAGERETSR